jgi:hypothetical protein
MHIAAKKLKTAEKTLALLVRVSKDSGTNDQKRGVKGFRQTSVVL